MSRMMRAMNTRQLKLHEWIDKGRANGTIREVMTVIWAYCLDEPAALKWVMAIVSGQVSENEALAVLEPAARAAGVFSELDAYQTCDSR